jgi:hypothetical protein
MIQYLGEIHTNPYRVRDARQEYKALKMKTYRQNFHEFKTECLHLANEAQIPNSERMDDMYAKFTIALQSHLLSQCFASTRMRPSATSMDPKETESASKLEQCGTGTRGPLKLGLVRRLLARRQAGRVRVREQHGAALGRCRRSGAEP